MQRYINGPINYIKLQGQINNITKDIFIFIDKHYELSEQTKCESYDSIDIAQYLYKLIKTSEISLDFFMEIRDEKLRLPKNNKRDIYIGEVEGLFKSEFVINKDQVKYAKSNNKVKLHYLDIRDQIEFMYILDIIKY